MLSGRVAPVGHGTGVLLGKLARLFGRDRPVLPKRDAALLAGLLVAITETAADAARQEPDDETPDLAVR
jgi:hypothetical protein